jgi:hypothetical protein
MAEHGSFEIIEIEGQERWRAVLYGRAVPRGEQPIEWGVDARAEDTFFHGLPEGRTEPLGIGFPDLVFNGEWKQMHILTGDARVELSPPSSKYRSPHELCDLFEEFAARQKVLEITWSGGLHRVARWASFRAQPGRGPDRRWTMSFKVLARAQGKVPRLPVRLTAGSSLASLKKAAKGIDDALGDLPDGLQPSFMDKIREGFGNARQALADVRKKLHDVGDLARAPADVLREMTMLAQSARDTLKEASEIYDDTAYEYQVSIANAETMLRARSWKTRVLDAADGAMDGILALLDYLASQDVTPKRWVSVAAGDSLVKLAVREYGPGNGDLWKSIADANGLVSQIAPAGVSRLVIPEV